VVARYFAAFAFAFIKNHFDKSRRSRESFALLGAGVSPTEFVCVVSAVSRSSSACRPDRFQVLGLQAIGQSLEMHFFLSIFYVFFCSA